jgi:hypothetical protein
LGCNVDADAEYKYPWKCMKEKSVGISLASLMIRGVGILVKACWYPLHRYSVPKRLCWKSERWVSVKRLESQMASIVQVRQTTCAYLYTLKRIKLSRRSVRPVINTLHVTVYFEVHQALWGLILRRPGPTTYERQTGSLTPYTLH